MLHRYFSALLILIFALSIFSTVSAAGSRPGYIYDTAEIISDQTQSYLDSYLRNVDDATTVEIVVYTIPSYIGHGIKKDGQEIQERDMLANYLFNEVQLDGITGIGKKGKDNGILVLLSLERDSGGGSMRIEIGRGMEGDITDGTAGAILDSYLVPARESYEETGDIAAFDKAFVDTVISLAQRAGYVSEDAPSEPIQDFFQDEIDPMTVILLVLFFGAFITMAILGSRRRRRRGYYGPYGGGWGGSGGGFGGGGGRSGGGGAGR
ncbi:MAG: TPM domain-containing protein [Nitrosopumilaceae archaeon]